jgi:hypothetical protein
MSDRTPAQIDPLELVSRIDFSLARPPAGLPQFVPVRLAPESAAHAGGRVYVLANPWAAGLPRHLLLQGVL